LFNDVAGEAVSPLLPAFIRTLGGGPQALGMIEGVADATASLMQLSSGVLADRSGKLKALTSAGYAIAIILRPLLSLVTAWWQILFIRVGDRAGKGIRRTPRDTLVAHLTPAPLRGRGYGLYHGLEYIGALLGPGIAYLMLSLGIGLRAVFGWTLVPGALCLLVLAIFVKDAERGPPVRTALGLPPSPVYRRFLLAVFVFTLGSSSDAFLLWHASEVGVAFALAPILWMVLQTVKSATSFWGGALNDRYGRRAAIAAGWVLYAAVYLGFALANASWQIWSLFAMYGAFYGLTSSAQKALVVDVVDKDWRGRALGTYNAVVGITALLASLIFGVLYQGLGPKVAFESGAAFAALAALILPAQRC
jgi:MFS family permease